jgi:putative ABC transport system permease protein
VSAWRAFVARVAELFRSKHVERDLDDELHSHLDLLTDEHVRRGLNRDEARRAAHRDLGGLEQTRELVRDRRGFRGLEALMQDIRIGIRQLIKAPGFTSAAVITLALGIGANTAIFSLVDAVLLRPVSYPEPERLVAIWEVQHPRGARSVVAPANYVDYVKRTRAFSALTAYTYTGRNLSGDGTPERLIVEEVTASYFATLGVRPSIGRPFDAEESVESRRHVAILTDAFWRRRFGASADVLSRRLTLDGESYQIVGVMPPDFRAPSDARPQDPVSVILPIVFEAELLANRHDHEVDVIGRIKPGLSVETARADLTSVSNDLAAEFPDAADTRAALAPLGADQAKDVRTLLVWLLGAVALVLLIACANVASLVVVRSIARQREVAVRFVLGATRWRLMSELVTQSLVLSVIGAAAGVAVAYVTKGVLVSLAPATFPFIQRAALDGRVLAFTALLAIATGLIFGVMPAWQISRARPIEALRTADRAMAGGHALRRRNALMVVEVALATLLLVGAGLMVRSLMAVNSVPLGFEPAGVLATNIVLPNDRYKAPQAKLAFFEELATKVRAIPGVEGVAFANRLPLRGNWESGFFFEHPRNPAAPKHVENAGFQSVSGEYFDVFRIPLLAGRGLAADYRSGAPGVAVVNAAFGRTFFGGGNPLGQRIQRGRGMPWITIVGIVADIRRGGRLSDVAPQVYLPAAQTELYPLPLSDLALRVDGAPRAVADAVRSAIWSIDPNQPVTNVRTLDEVLMLRLAERRFQTFLFGFFAALALTLAIVGVYGVVDYAVRQRTPEIGLRLALGADAPRILRWVLGQSLVLVGAGAAAGLGAAMWLSKYVRTLLFGIEPTDVVTYVGAAAILALAAFGASYLAARHATQVDPASALK